MNHVRDSRFLVKYAASSEGKYIDECWPWASTKSKQGYGVISFDGKQYRVSRLLLSASPDEQVMHVCDNPPCVNPSHLQRGTIRENQYDKGRKGRAARGERNRGGDKLNDEKVRAIRARLDDSDNPTLAQIGREFGVSSTLIAKIRDKGLWRHTK